LRGGGGAKQQDHVGGNWSLVSHVGGGGGTPGQIDTSPAVYKVRINICKKF
jgi:hypothetical protein